MNVAIIPARGGSKRIPRKNIKLFGGSPLISYSIKAALKSGLFDRVVVSTDDNEIAKVARSYGADVPFVRPPEHSGDYVTTVAAVSHAVQWLHEHGSAIEFACCIYATAPLLDYNDIRGSLPVLRDGSWDYVFSATSFAYSVFRAITRCDDGSVRMLYPENLNARSQDLPEVWHDAGQFYWGRTEAWLNQLPIIASSSTIFQVPRWRVQDIDTLEDWTYAELLYRLSLEKMNV